VNQGFPNIKRVCIYGTGGVGGYFGGRIAEAFQQDKSDKREIYFIARGKHLEALQRNGITVKTPERIIKSIPTKAAQYFHEIPDPDLILLCTKSYDLKAAVKDIKTKTKENTVIIPLLNGIDIYERIRTDLESGMVLPSCVYLGTHIETPGIISQSGGNGIILSGKDPQFPLYTAENVRQFFKELGIGFEWNDSPYPAIWEKFIFIAAFGLVTASSGAVLGEVVKKKELNEAARGIIREIVTIAGKKNVKLPEDIVERSMKKAGNFPYETRTSFQRDVESWPKPNEGDLFGAAILREGVKFGIPTPFTEKTYSRVLQIERKQ
jgi:2-dehydropantoate 2-reductase